MREHLIRVFLGKDVLGTLGGGEPNFTPQSSVWSSANICSPIECVWEREPKLVREAYEAETKPFKCVFLH